MTATVARAVMAVAIRSLGERRREWALAMRAEFGAAEEDGRPLAFALGCLLAAWRELPAHDEGRLTIAAYALALALLIPMSAMLASSVLFDFPFSHFGPGGVHGWPEAAGGRTPWLNDGNRSAVPSLALLLTILAASQLRMAWLVLDRDWTRVAMAARLISAATAALVLFSALVFADLGSALVQAAMSAVALGATAMVARASRGWPERVGEACG